MMHMPRQWGAGDGSEDDDDRSFLERLEGEQASRINPRHLQEALREVINDPPNIPRFLSVLHEVATQTDPFMRAEVIEQVPKLAVICVCERLDLIERRLLPIILEALGDSDSQVRKTAQSGLLVLVEQDLVSVRAIENEICTAVNNLADDCIVNGIVLMGKLAQLLGKEATIRLFLDKFSECCHEEEFASLRETCAKNFGEICAVLGHEISETRMVQLFCRLCQDGNWCVRKACAEVLMLVSCSVPMEARRTHLTEELSRLLDDPEYWVRAMAYQVLGAFISTFADPPVTGLAYDPYGELIFVGPEGYEFRVTSHQHMSPRGVGINLRRMSEWPDSVTDNEDGSTAATSEVEKLEQDVDSFNSFQYWQIPLPELGIDLSEEDDIQANLTSLDYELASLSEKLDKCTSKDMGDEEDSVISDASTPDSGWNSGTATPLQPSVPSILRLPDVVESPGRIDKVSTITNTVYYPYPLQSVVPQKLLNSFINMVKPAAGDEQDKDLALHCSYFLPAVASTLGPANWCWLSDLYRALAFDKQWKVRRTVACCLHDLAILLGEKQTNADLAPVLRVFLKDLDEVRIGALRNLAATLKLFRPVIRNKFLPFLKDIIPTQFSRTLSDGDRNWRFREEVAIQLALAAPLFSPSDCFKFIGWPAFALLTDRIAAVRKKALVLMTQLINLLSTEAVSRAALLDHLFSELAEHSVWSRRAVFAQLCSELASPTDAEVLSSNHFDCQLFATYILPHLLRLACDPVPNVRLCVARCLSRDLIFTGYISESNPVYPEVLQVLVTLQRDRDRDVREAAHDGIRRFDDVSDVLSSTASCQSTSSEHLASSP